MAEAFLRIFHYYNDWVASLFSIVSNILLVYLIFKYTAAEFKAYSKILLQTCCIDLFFTVIVFITKPVIEFNQGVFFLFISGFVSNLRHPLNFYLNMIWVIGFFFCITALPVQFFYRYMLVCRKIKLSNKIFVLLFLLSFFFAFTYTLIAGIAFQPTFESINKNIAMLNNSLWADETGQILVFVASDITNPALVLMLIYCLLLGGLCYMLIIVFNILIWKTIAATQHTMSKRTREAQRQLNYALIMQSISPLITVFLPTTITGTCLLLRLETSGIGILIMCAVGWITAINPTSAILFVAPYRQAFLRWLGIGLNRPASLSDSNPRNQNPLPAIAIDRLS